MKPTPEQFEEWRAHPVTEWVFDTFLRNEMLRTRETFEGMAWEGQTDPVSHATHRERYETLDWVCGLDMDTIEATLEKQE